MDIPALPGTAMSLTPEIESKAVTYDSADTEKKKAIEAIMQDINLKDRGSILYFGSKAQEEMTSVSETMLEGVRNKDLGVAGEALGSMIQNIREFDVDELNPNRKQGFFEKLFNNNPLTDFMDRYTDVRKQITTITDRLEEHKTQLLTDIVTLDKLYDANLDYFKQLELYIAAGDERLRLLDTKDIPELAGKAEADLENMLIAQEVRDLRSARDDLERRVHDLKLTRQVAMQSLPSIRLVQENDKSLVNKINSTIVNTVPLWKNQLAQAVTMFRMGNAAKTVKDATDLTNDLLEANANTLREGNQEVRRQMERGVFDIESVKLANQSLIDTINDSLRITDEGKAARANAEKELQNMESELRKVLIAAKSQASR
ncbi:MAG TPA: toxic anion resistance protein [Thiothrix sp.]|nr:toxic anion resistance protein [Thiothrix sp.]